MPDTIPNNPNPLPNDDDIVVVEDSRVGGPTAIIGQNMGPYTPPIVFSVATGSPSSGQIQMTCKTAKDSGYTFVP